MNLYEAIFLRKSVRNYEMEALKPSLLTEIKDYCKQIEGLNPGITTDISIIDNTKGQYKRVHLLGVKAPYYLAFYSEDKDKAMLNAGYILEQLALFLFPNFGFTFPRKHVPSPFVHKNKANCSKMYPAFNIALSLSSE